MRSYLPTADRRLCATLFGTALGLALLSPQIATAGEAPTNAANPLTVPQQTIFPNGTHLPPEDPEAKNYFANPQAIAKGRELYDAYNCSGCHFHGAGGMGPPFMNGGHWRFGGKLDQIYASIYEGRPAGMPAWGSSIPPEQIWEISAYVKALSIPDLLRDTGGPPMPKSEASTKESAPEALPPGSK